MESDMSRCLSLVLAAALAASTASFTAAPAAATEVGVTVQTVGWDGNRRDWRDRDDWRWRHHRRDRDRHFAPGFFFNFGIPHPQARAFYHPRRDCFRNRYGELYCRAY
jgi:hypothetical protein